MRVLILFQEDMVCQVKKSSAGCRTSFLELFSCSVGTSRMTQAPVISIGCPPELDRKTLLLKDLTIGFRKWRIQVGTGQEVPCCWIAFIVLKGAMEVSGGGDVINSLNQL